MSASEQGVKMKEQYDFEIQFYETVLKHHPKYVDVIEILGGLYTRQGRVDEGLKMDRKLVRLMPENPTAHYNLGCSLALKRKKADAIRALQTAIDLGYKDFEWMHQDPDLECLRAHPLFIELLEKMKAS